MESLSSGLPPTEVSFYLDYFDENEPQEVYDMFRSLRVAAAENDVSRLLFDSYEAALALYPQDSKDSPGRAADVYRTFIHTEDPRDKIYILIQLHNLWQYDPESASDIIRECITQAGEDDALVKEAAVGMHAIALQQGVWVAQEGENTDLRFQRVIRREVI